MKKYILFILIINCYSCYNVDNDNTQFSRIEQTLVSSETLKPLAGFKVYLLNFGVTIDSTITDKNGYYFFDVFSISQNRDYSVRIATKLYEQDSEYNSDKVLYLTPLSWLRIHVKNSSPFDEYDRIELRDFPKYEKIEFKGKNVDTTFIKKIVYQNEYLKNIGYEIRKNNKAFYTKVNLNLKNFDTIAININY